MAIINKNRQENIEAPSTELEKVELEVLLSLIKRGTFVGEDIELLYNLVLKLQQMYINKQSNERI